MPQADTATCVPYSMVTQGAQRAKSSRQHCQTDVCCDPPKLLLMARDLAPQPWRSAMELPNAEAQHAAAEVSVHLLQHINMFFLRIASVATSHVSVGGPCSKASQARPRNLPSRFCNKSCPVTSVLVIPCHRAQILQLQTSACAAGPCAVAIVVIVPTISASQSPSQTLASRAPVADMAAGSDPRAKLWTLRKGQGCQSLHQKVKNSSILCSRLIPRQAHSPPGSLPVTLIPRHARPQPPA